MQNFNRAGQKGGTNGNTARNTSEKTNLQSLQSSLKRVNLFWCLLWLIISDLLFSKMLYLNEKISSSSLRQIQSFFFLVVLRGRHFLMNIPVTFGVKWLRFIVQYYLDSSMLFSWCSRLNDFLWLLSLCLKSVSAVPM